MFGLSAQTTEYQKEARDRLHLPFQLLSDSALRLKLLLGLPTFTVAGRGDCDFAVVPQNGGPK